MFVLREDTNHIFWGMMAGESLKLLKMDVISTTDFMHVGCSCSTHSITAFII